MVVVKGAAVDDDVVRIPCAGDVVVMVDKAEDAGVETTTSLERMKVVEVLVSATARRASWSPVVVVVESACSAVVVVVSKESSFGFSFESTTSSSVPNAASKDDDSSSSVV